MLLAALAAAGTMFAGDLRVERIFGPEVPTGSYKHPACITEFQNGDLHLAYYGGAGEYAVDTGVFGSRSKKGATRWTQPRLLASDPFRSVGNGVVWQAPDGLVWLFYVVRWGDGKIHVVYTSGRAVIHHAFFDEEWVKQGSGQQPSPLAALPASNARR